MRTNSIYQKRKHPKHYADRKLTCGFGTQQPKVRKAKGRWQHWWLWVHDQVLSDEDLVCRIWWETWCTVVHSHWWGKIPLFSHRFSLMLDGWNMGSLECFSCLFRVSLHSTAWLVRSVSQKLLDSTNKTTAHLPWLQIDHVTFNPFSSLHTQPSASRGQVSVVTMATRFWGTWRTAHLLGTLRAEWRGSGDRVSLSQEAPWRGPRGGLLYRGTWKMRFLRKMQMSCRRASMLIGALLGNPEGIRLSRLLREINSISEYRYESEGHSGFKTELGFNLTQTYISGFLPFGPRE